MRVRKFWIVVWLLLLTPLCLWLAWLFTPLRPLNIAIIDKTVLLPNLREHISFNWILTNQRISKMDKEFYEANSDYLGFFPKTKKKYEVKGLEQYSLSQIDSFAGKLDMAYFTDTYGIYSNEWEGKNILEHSPLIYGGMSTQDLHLLKALKKSKKLILTEFNDIATPTPKNIRNEFQSLFGIEWTGWAGRYYDDLDTNINKELPYWLKNGYVKQHANRWPFKKSGIAFVNENGRIEILEKDTHLEYELPYIKSEESTMNRFNVKDDIDYPYWFDIIRTSRENNILSWYEIKTNTLGDSVLAKNGIPKRFPAAIERSIDCKFYYFCGDFADNPVSQWLARFKYIGKIKRTLSAASEKTDKTPFFWKYYVPMISTILNENFK